MQLAGRTIGGNYRLQQLIAEGTTAQVYQGLDIGRDEPVAVKILRESLIHDASLTERFCHEAEVQARLSHPHIVAAKDFVRDHEMLAIVLEYLDGGSLAELLAALEAPLGPSSIKKLMLPLLDAVGYAHRQGIVHRDLKPSNVLIGTADGELVPKVMDFGIAKVLGPALGRTAPGALLGTLLYMSPEQCKARAPVDQRSDIYSLGVVLYQMATTMVPFYGEGAFEIMLAHVQSLPTPPRQLNPSCPAALERVIVRALAKDPEDRFATVAEMSAALQRIEDSAQPPRATLRLHARAADGAKDFYSAGTIVPVEKSDVRGRYAHHRRRRPLAGPASAPPASAALRLRVPEGSWDRFFDGGVAGGGVFCPTPDPPPVGTTVRLGVSFVGGPRLQLHGVVTWRRPRTRDARAKAGVGIQVHPNEHAKLAYVQAWSQGHVDNRRARRRLPLRLAVRYSSSTGWRESTTADLDARGLFVRANGPPAVGSPVQLQLQLPGTSRPVNLRARVSHAVASGEDRGFGLRLRFDSAARQARFAGVVDALERDYLAGALPDEVVA